MFSFGHLFDKFACQAFNSILPMSLFPVGGPGYAEKDTNNDKKNKLHAGMLTVNTIFKISHKPDTK